MTTAYHGGGCCGMRHISSFGQHGPTADRIVMANAAMENYTEGRGNILAEVVLTDGQLTEEVNGRTWVHWLREKGFRRVTRFRNGNSANICNVFHKTPDRMTEADKANDPWGRPARARRR